MSDRFQNQDGWLENVGGKLYVVSKEKLDIRAKFKTVYGYFYEAKAGWESWNGCYWFQLTKADTDNICYGYVQLVCASFGKFSIDELKELRQTLKVWPIGKQNLPYSGITDQPRDWFYPVCATKIIWKSQEIKELFKILNPVSFTDDELLKVVGNCSYSIKGKDHFELDYKGEIFGTYKLLENENSIELDITNDDLFKKAILDFQADQKS